MQDASQRIPQEPANDESAYTAESVAEALTRYGLGEEDQNRLPEIGKVIVPQLDEYITDFYEWIGRFPAYIGHFTSEEQLSRAQRLQVNYWRDFFQEKRDVAYFASREHVGRVHARIGLPLAPYIAGMHVSHEIFVGMLGGEGMSPETALEATTSLTKAVHLDTEIVADTFTRLTGERIAEQSEAILSMSTPVTAIWDQILLLPLVGVIDSERSQTITEAILSEIAQSRARVFILDISGVAVVDTAVANHMVKITRATELMGCRSIISGLSAQIAQTMVDLDINTSGILTTATLRDALESAFSIIGTKVIAQA